MFFKKPTTLQSFNAEIGPKTLWTYCYQPANIGVEEGPPLPSFFCWGKEAQKHVENSISFALFYSFFLLCFCYRLRRTSNPNKQHGIVQQG